MPSAKSSAAIPISDLIGESEPSCFEVRTKADGPAGALPLTDEMLRPLRLPTIQRVSLEGRLLPSRRSCASERIMRKCGV